MTTHVGAACAYMADTGWELLVGGRAVDNRSRLGRVAFEVGEWGVELGRIDPTPVLEVGDPNSFYADGVSYPWVFEWLGRECLLFTGWKRSGKGFLNSVGIAFRSTQREAWKVDQHPLFPDHPLGTGSSCFWMSPDGPRLVVTSFTGWSPFKDREIPNYELRWAYPSSRNRWRLDEVVQGLGPKDSKAVARPCISRVADRLVGTCSVREGNRYRIEGGEWLDGAFRSTQVLRFCAQGDGWESDSVEYGFLAQIGDQVVVFYSGNDFGKSGMGAATARVKDFVEAI